MDFSICDHKVGFPPYNHKYGGLLPVTKLSGCHLKLQGIVFIQSNNIKDAVMIIMLKLFLCFVTIVRHNIHKLVTIIHYLIRRIRLLNKVTSYYGNAKQSKHTTES